MKRRQVSLAASAAEWTILPVLFYLSREKWDERRFTAPRNSAKKCVIRRSGACTARRSFYGRAGQLVRLVRIFVSFPESPSFPTPLTDAIRLKDAPANNGQCTNAGPSICALRVE